MSLSKPVDQRDEEVRIAGRITVEAPQPEEEDAPIRVKPGPVVLVTPRFFRRPEDNRPGHVIVRPGDGPAQRPQTPEEIAAYNAAVMAENERERQKKVGKYLPGDYVPVKGRPRVKRSEGG